jgi:hypothetical protein
MIMYITKEMAGLRLAPRQGARNRIEKAARMPVDFVESLRNEIKRIWNA